MGEANAAWAAYRGKMAAIHSGETFTSQPGPMPAAILFHPPGAKKPKNPDRWSGLQAALAEWTRKDLKRREDLIRDALRQFLTDQEIDLMIATRSTAPLDYLGLKVATAYLPAPSYLEDFPGISRHVFRILRDNETVLEISLDPPGPA